MLKLSVGQIAWIEDNLSSDQAQLLVRFAALAAFTDQAVMALAGGGYRHGGKLKRCSWSP